MIDAETRLHLLEKVVIELAKETGNAKIFDSLLKDCEKGRHIRCASEYLRYLSSRSHES
jgi:hypothetical protein